MAGIPIFAQLANALADAGYMVVRYDERGAGQSGGRQESATIDEFAIDAHAVVTYLLKRRDVDPKRVSLIGYGEGGWIAMLVAAREQKVAAVALVATPSTPGTELVLEQQRLLFEQGSMSPAVQQAAIDQQKKILEAVVTGKGWENFNAEVRKRVDTPLYRSFLMFDPSQAIVKVRQPMLVVQPMLDREVPTYHGEQLAQLARSRPRAKPAEFVQLTGVNHLLARATTGEIAEYSMLPQRSVSPSTTLELTSWLAKALAPEPQK
jgi:pimeloyl-ACP methyl ester carboxylesterase